MNHLTSLNTCRSGEVQKMSLTFLSVSRLPVRCLFSDQQLQFLKLEKVKVAWVDAPVFPSQAAGRCVKIPAAIMESR